VLVLVLEACVRLLEVLLRSAEEDVVLDDAVVEVDEEEGRWELDLLVVV